MYGISKIVCVFVAGFCLACSPALAGEYEDGKAAYDSGNYTEALKHWLPLADKGDYEASFALARMYENGQGVSRDYSIAALYYTKSAEPGYPPAQAMIGIYYEIGRGVKQDYATAADWYQKAASQNRIAAYRLGSLYRNGHGVPRDFRTAMMWIELAARNYSFPPAQFDVAMMNYTGDDPTNGMVGVSKANVVPKNYVAAKKWLLEAAENGEPRAQLALGDLYAKAKALDPAFGSDIEQDNAKAAALYRKSADQGNSRAQSRLGDAYLEGRGVTQNFAEAKKWLQLSSDQGFPYAQYKLGIMYASGKGVKIDPVAAEMWLILSASRENEETRQAAFAKARDTLAASMLAEQIEKAQSLAAQWKPKPSDTEME